MATKHTPGPWETPSLEDSRSIRSTDTGEYVATAHSKHDFSGLSGTYPDADAAEANARLIAAAPELLKALIDAEGIAVQRAKELADQGSRFAADSIWHKVKYYNSVIAKTTG